MDEIVPRTVVAGPPLQAAPERRIPPWLFRLATVVAVAAVAAVFASGQRAQILNSLKRATSPAPAVQPVAPAPPPPASQTPAPTTPAPVTQPAPPGAVAPPGQGTPPASPAQARVEVTNFALTSFTAGAAPEGLRVKMSGAFVLSGAPARAVAEVAPTWVVRGGKRQYGRATPVPVKNGPVKVSGTALIARASPSDYIDCLLAVRIAGQEFVSPARGFVVASVVPRPPGPAKAPTPPAPPLGPSPVQPSAPSPPAAPTSPVPPLGPGPVVSVTDLKLTPISSVTVVPEGKVWFTLTFTLAGPQQTTVESMIGWRGADGALRYGRPVTVPAAQGANTLSGLSFTATADTPPGTIVPVYGALKIGDRLYQTQSPTRITVAGVPRQAPPASEPPPRQPPVVQPAPPRFARSSICGFWHSDYGDVTFRCPSTLDEGPVHITGTWRQAPGKWGTITGGTFDPSTGIVTFNYYEPWIDDSGSARLTMEPGATRMTGTWQQTSGSGSWTMWR